MKKPAALLESFFSREAERLRIEAAFLLGSRAMGSARPDSDVDVAILFSDDAGPDTAFDRANDVAAELGRALGAEIDVVVLDRDFSRPMLAFNAIVKGIPVYLKDPGTLAALRNEALRQKEDFSLFGVGWQLAVARRNLEIASRA